MIASAVTKSQVVVYINGQKYYIHTVESKETIYSIAKTYDVDEQTIIDLNSDQLQAGENIRIPFSPESKKKMSKRQIRRTFSKHKIKSDETLYSISRKYGISIDVIMEDNPSVDPIALSIGSELLIRKDMKGQSTDEEILTEWTDYQEDLNLISESQGYRYHIVKAGETIYSLAREAKMSEKEFIELNNLEDGLKADAIIKMPIKITEETTEEVEIETEEKEERELVNISMSALKSTDTLKIALFLPLSSEGKVNYLFADFYKGFEMGLNLVKTKWGHNIELSLYNSDRNAENIARVIESEEFKGTNLIVGPVYEDLLEPIIEYAEAHKIPVVSPLATLKNTRSNVLFQLAAPAENKYNKIKELFDEKKHVTLIYTEHTDSLFNEDIMQVLGERPHNRHFYYYGYKKPASYGGVTGITSSGDNLSPFINNYKDNTIVVMSNNETEVDRILSGLSSIQSNVISRGGKAPKYRVLGNVEWSRFRNIDHTILFKNNVSYISSYHAKRDSRIVKRFDSNHIKKYGTMPSLYTYRGFDVAVIFAEAMYSDILYNLEDRTYKPLQSTYSFTTDPETLIHVNQEWTMVNYENNYTITIE